MRRNTNEKLPYQRVGDSVIDGLIGRHGQTWGFDWPHGRGYAAELYLEAKADLGLAANAKGRRAEVADLALTLMRESHHFPDHPAPCGTADAVPH